MTRAMVPAACLLVSALTLPGRAERTCWADDQRPNIVLIMVDDMGYSDIGCYGSEIETPHLDALASGGVRFDQFYNSGRCCPTRATLLTGLHPHQAGIGLMTLSPGQMPTNRPANYQGFLNRQCVTIAEALREGGYKTFMTGKWHLGMHDQSLWPRQRGFDEFFGIVAGAARFFHPVHPRGITLGNEKISVPESTTDEAFYTTDAFTDYGIDFIREHQESDDDQPFFLYLSYNAPHWPLQAFEDDIAKYRGKYKAGWEALRRSRYQRQIELGLIDPQWKLSEPEAKIPAWDSLSADKQDEMDLKMAVYAGMIDRVDQNIGKLVGHLKSSGEFENTLILFLSDNGGCAEGGLLGRGEFYDIEKRNQQTANAYGEAWANASNTPFRLYKHYAHEGGTATPFFMHWPRGIHANRDWYREPAQLVDVMPTLLDVAGAEYPQEFAGEKIVPLEGVSLRPAFKGRPLDRSEPLFVEHQNNSFVREGKWKLVGRGVAGPKGADPAKWELYDMQSDRTETNDLAKAKPGVVRELAAKWDEWSEHAGVYPKPVRRQRNANPPAKPADQPNIIVILADDLGYSDLSCYGGEIDTPNIDGLAAGGARFTQVYTSARCCPSRASMMTGLYPTQAGIGDFTTNNPSPNRGPGYLGRLNDNCATIAEVLKPAGYGCYYVGKWHMHPETGPIKRGFDEFYGYTRGHSHNQYDADYYIRLPEGRAKEIDPPAADYYATDVFNDYAIEFIKQGQKADKPWFLFLGHSSPHFPVQAPAERADKYDEIYRRGWDLLREERFSRMQEIGLINGPHWKLSPRSLVPVDRDDIANGFAGKENPAWDSLDDARQLDLARRMSVFAAMVEGVDNGVGEIIDHLKQTGDLDNTLILLLSDNGACYEWGPFGFDGTSRRGTTTLRTGDDLRGIGGRGTHQSYGSAWSNLGNTPFRLYKHFTHEGGISTPFIAHWPQGIGKPNRWVRDPAHVMDLMPTLIEAAGASYPNRLNNHEITPLEGTSLLPAMRGESLPARTIGFDHQAAHAIRKGDWKAVYGKRMPHESKWELYNLAEDRCEMNDLAERYPDHVKQLIAEWETWAKRVGVIWKPGSQAALAQVAKAKNESPPIANRALKIEVTVESDNPHGVAIAQGGNQHGYSLHFIDGRPAFDVRVSGSAKRLLAQPSVSGTITLTATLSADSMTLSVNGGETISQASPGLIPVQPIDALSVGFDERTAAGNYQPPNRLRGRVLRYSVDRANAGTRRGSRARKERDANNTGRVPSRPNFVFILTDDQGWTGLSVPLDKSRPSLQSDFYQTPNIARLATAGMRFSRGYSPAPNCSPSRYANLTGKTCARLSFTDIVGRGHNTDLKGKQKLRPGGKNTREIRWEDVTIPELLKTLPSGYRTAHFGKWHLGGGGPERHGFDVSDGATGNRQGSEGPTVKDDPKRAYSITERANSFMAESVAAGRPFYCQVSHYAVHAKIQHRAETLAKTTGWKPGKNHSDPAYAAMVADLDEAVGQVLDQIEALGIADNTYIIYQADNGSPKFLSESPPLRRFKPEIWDGGIRVPTFLAGPGIAADSQCDQPVMGIDILPTIWELAGGEASALPDDIDGGSIVPALAAISEAKGNRPKAITRRGELVVHSPHYVLTKDLAKNQRPSSAIFDGRWKLVAWYETGDVQLFDLDTEISESTDVSDRNPTVKQGLYLRLRDYLSNVEALLPTLDPMHESHPDAKEGDADGDGLPDDWEFRELLTHVYGPDDDPDQDGKSNLAEFRISSDPLVAD